MSTAKPQRRGATGAGEDLPGRLSLLIREVVGGETGGVGRRADWDLVLRPGAIVAGRFELARELGRGDVGVVYQARDLSDGRDVAFKAVVPGRGASESSAVLEQEAEVLARLEHPCIARLHDAGRCEQGPWLSMELLRGQSLEQRLELGAMSVPEAVRIAAEVARGLAHAHAHGALHRDLSPRTVFLCHDGRVKLLDLGLAHAFGRRRLAGGTPAYLAPEQWLGGPEDQRVDVFSLGTILFRMLAGELPAAEGGTVERPAPVVEVEEAPALGRLVARMLARHPVERPRDAGQVLAALEGLRAELDRSPTSVTTRPTVRRPWSRRVRVVLLAAAAAAAVLAAATWYGLLGAGHRPSPSVAVLPFEELGPREGAPAVADAVEEEIREALGRVEGLRVVARSASERLRAGGAGAADVGRPPGAGAVLEGRIRRQGSQLRVTVELVDAADGFRRWGRSFDGDAADVRGLGAEVALGVAEALGLAVAGGGGGRAQEGAARP